MTDEERLEKQIAQCGDNLPKLMHDTQVQINAAVGAGDLDDAQTLRARMRDINFAFGKILDGQIAQIDSSDDMKKAIAGFAAVNKAIKTQLDAIKTIQSFVDTLNSLLGTLNTAVGIAFKKSASGGAGDGGNGS